MSSLGLDPTALLRTDGRLRVLARELVRDPGEAEDLVQETWLAALEAGEIQSLPGWVATVVRRIALDRRRGAKRRERREENAARPEAVPAAEELLEREEARRRVVEALLALDEPLRATLILRFLEELPPRAVAARMEVPVETVRSRTRRGLAELRARLDRSFGERATWCAALVHLFRHPSAAEALSTALVVMSIQKKLAVAVVVCALGWLAWPRRTASGETVSARVAETPAVLQGPLREGTTELARAEDVSEREALSVEPTASAHDAFGSLRVSVSWFDGTPAEGIAVHAQREAHENPGLDEREASTDRAGVALFSRLSAGPTSVALDRGVHASASIEAGKEAALELVIPRGIDVLGRVEDMQGVALAGAEVWMAWHGIFLDGTLAARSDADGSFRLRSVRDQTVLGACAAGFRPSAPEHASGREGGEVTVRLVLWRGAGEVAGRIVDAVTGRPMSGAFVGVGPSNSMEAAEGTVRSDPWARTARTDEDGSYRFTGVALGSCSVAARAPGHALARAELEVREGRSETADLALLAESALEGHVLDEAGRPLSGVLVVVGHGVDWLRAVDETGADGSFHIGELQAEATLEARVYRKRGLGECIASTEFQTLPGQTSVWEARLGQRGSLHGRVLDENGGPLADWIVELHSGFSGGLERTGPDGGFRFENLDQRTHRLEARALDSLFASLERTDVRPSEEELVLRVPRERLSSVHIVGRFLDEGGQPIPGAEVWVGTGNHSTPAKLDEASGAFAYGPAPAGKWRVYAEAPGHAKFFIGERELAPDETWDCEVVRLAREGSVVARLLVEGIELGPDLLLRIRDTTRVWRPEGFAASDALVRSVALPPGLYELVVLGGDYAKFDVPFEIRSGEETHINVPIRRGRRATVAVRCDDAELRELQVSATPAGDARALSQTVGRSSDGAFRHTLCLVPGTYRVEARSGERRAEGELVVDGGEGETSLLELSLP